MPEAASRGGSGRKLHELEGRFDTRVKISEMRRCWMLVSCFRLVSTGLCHAFHRARAYQLRVKLGQPRLSLAVEDQKSVNHGARSGLVISLPPMLEKGLFAQKR